MRYTIGIDFGGGASKATLLREDGVVVATSSDEYPTAHLHLGWSEQNPDDWFRSCIKNIRRVLSSSGIDPDDVTCIAFDGGTHVAVLLDADDRVIRPAIYWTDKRSVKEAANLEENYSSLISSLSLNAPNPLWTLPQLMWLRTHESDAYSRIEKVMFLKDYVRYLLTGDFVTDSIEAMGSLLLDVTRNSWSGVLCELAGLIPEQLPEIVEPTEILSPLTQEAVRLTGLSRNTQVIAGATDTVMEVFASGAVMKGQATVKLATAGRICSITDKSVYDPLLVNYRHVVPGLWYPGTATKSCAASFRWFRDELSRDEMRIGKEQGIDPYVIMDTAASKIPAGSDNLYFHPYLEGEITPYLDNALRASFTGISGFHTKGHFNRAVMEGVAYSLRECLDVMKGLDMDIHSAAIIGGGAQSPLWRQITADILGIPLVKMKDCDSSLGSAMLAGIAAGMFDSYEGSVDTCLKVESYTEPNPETMDIYTKGYSLYKQLHDALAPIYHIMAETE